MIFLDNQDITDPRINLAIEEYALKHLPADESYLLFYINQPSIIIGRNQNTIAEINQSYVEVNNILVVRRLSGGGAVYHDEGNLCYSFITKDDGNSFHNFRKFTQPVIDALQELGVPAELSGRNDIEVAGQKISGNAQYTSRGRLVTHGTLLFKTDFSKLGFALQVQPDKIAAKGVASVRSRVVNIGDLLQIKLSMAEFKQTIKQSLFAGEENITTYQWTEEDWQNIHRLSEERYANWDWNYGKSPDCQLQRSKRFPIGRIDIHLNLNKGMIQTCKIYGDFFSKRDIAELEHALIGVRYLASAVEERLVDFHLQDFFGNLSREEFISLLLSS